MPWQAGEARPSDVCPIAASTSTPSRKVSKYVSALGSPPRVAATQQRVIGLATTAIALAVIARLTLWPGPGGLPRAFQWCLVCGSYGSADFALNVLLFVPLGFGLRLAGTPRYSASLAVIASTVLIEALQFYVVPGRESDLSGIISNTIGGLVGVAIADLRAHLVAPDVRVARRVAIGVAAVVCALAEVVQRGLAPSLPHSIYYEQVAPDLGMFDVYRAPVITPTFDGAPFREGRLSADSGDLMRVSLLDGRASIRVAIRSGPVPLRLAPIISVFDQRHHEIFLLGRRGTDVVFRLRRRANDFRWRSPALFLSLGEPPTLHQSPDTAHVRAAVRPGRIELSVADLRGTRTVEEKRGVWQAWRFLVPDSVFASAAGVLTALWIAGLFVPLGYWSGQGARASVSSMDHRVSPTRALRYSGPLLLLDLVSIAAVFAIIPWMAGAPGAPLGVWAAGLGATAIGWGLALLLDRRTNITSAPRPLRPHGPGES